MLDEILRFARVVEKTPIRLDKQRLCFLVADDEWDALVSYQNTIRYTNLSDNPTGMVSMSVLGIEIVKRTAIAKVPGNGE